MRRNSSTESSTSDTTHGEALRRSARLKGQTNDKATSSKAIATSRPSKPNAVKHDSLSSGSSYKKRTSSEISLEDEEANLLVHPVKKHKSLKSSTLVAPSLPFDVFHAIGTLLDRSTLSTLARTCHIYHEYGVICLLARKVDIYLEAEDDDRSDKVAIPSFHRFMFADAPHRIPMLRKLELYSDDNSKLNREHAQLLTELLTQASNIAELHLPDFDEGISQFPELLHAIEALPFVKIFDVETDKFACIPAAEKMSSSLTKVRFRADDKYTGRMLPTLGLLRPLSSLYTHASTLQELDFMNVQITDATIVFPHVHTLRLHRSHNSDLKVLVATFPNLRNLDIFNDPIINRCIMWTITAEDYRQQFRKNRETPSWPRLESLSGSPLTLCILCVSCPIGRLTVYGPSRNEDNCSQTNNVIAGLVPVDTVVLRLDAIVDSATEESIHLAIPVSRCFERLVINISMSSSNNELAPEGTIEKLYELAGSISVTSFQLVMKCLCPGYPGRDEGRKIHQQFLQTFDPEAVARRFAKLMPKLKHVFLTVGCQKTKMNTTCWETTGGGAVVEKDASVRDSIMGDLPLAALN